ncbi:hypothetical protein M3558_11950 [Brevibacillus invocatus]|nr:hypothetical protein [Brevibacillus invocatus]
MGLDENRQLVLTASLTNKKKKDVTKSAEWESEDPDVVSSTGHAGDRNLVWAFSNHGIYELSTPLMGEPKNGLPQAK